MLLGRASLAPPPGTNRQNALDNVVAISYLYI